MRRSNRKICLWVCDLVSDRTLVERSLSFLLPSLFALLRWVRGFAWLDVSWVPSGSGIAVLLSLILFVSGGVSLGRSTFLSGVSLSCFCFQAGMVNGGFSVVGVCARRIVFGLVICGKAPLWRSVLRHQGSWIDLGLPRSTSPRVKVVVSVFSVQVCWRVTAHGCSISK